MSKFSVPYCSCTFMYKFRCLKSLLPILQSMAWSQFLKFLYPLLQSMNEYLKSVSPMWQPMYMFQYLKSLYPIAAHVQVSIPEILQSMYKNELSIISIKPSLAYGELGRRPDVPPNSRWGLTWFCLGLTWLWFGSALASLGFFWLCLCSTWPCLDSALASLGSGLAWLGSALPSLGSGLAWLGSALA